MFQSFTIIKVSIQKQYHQSDLHLRNDLRGVTIRFYENKGDDGIKIFVFIVYAHDI